MRIGLLAMVAVAGILGSRPVGALEDQVMVLTSYPEEVAGRFEAAFERLHPGTDVRILWRMSRDALTTLRQPDRGGVDVYWSPGLHNFPLLRDEGAWKVLAVDRATLPGRVGAQLISDPAGTYEAVEVAGYGLFFAPDYLRRHDLPEPRDWVDLRQPVYAGHVMMPVPSRVGFAPALVEVLLQGYGWENGWALLSEIAANARLIGGGPLVTDSVLQGEGGIGITMDFFALGAIAGGHPVRFIYPPVNGFPPARVAITSTAPHPEAAEAFVQYVLSAEGQKLLLHPDINRHPVRPDVYDAAPPWMTNPFQTPSQAGGQPDVTAAAYDIEKGLAREALDNALFDQLITTRIDGLRMLWATIHEAEQQVGDSPARAAALGQARALAALVPVPATLSDDPALRQIFARRKDDPAAAAQAEELERAWAARLDQAHGEALALARAVLTNSP